MDRSGSFVLGVTATLALAALGAGCGREADLPPTIGDSACKPGTCVSPGSGPGAGGGGGAGGSPFGGAGGAAGTEAGGGGQGGTVAAATVTARVVPVTTVELVPDPGTYPLPAVISAAGANPAAPPAVPWTGTGTVTLEGVASGPNWFKTTPTATAFDVLGSHLLADLPADTVVSLDLPVVETQVMNAIFTQLPIAATFNFDAPHAVLRIVDAQGQPVAGATVSPAFGAVLAYDESATYSGLETHELGTALLLNVVASGASNLVTAQIASGVTAAADLPLSPRHVTFATLVLQ